MSTRTDRSPARYVVAPWDLSELMPSEQESMVAGRLATLERRVQAFETCRDRLGPDMDPDELLDIVQSYERLAADLQVISAYGSLRFAEDTLSADALSLRNRIQNELTGFSNRILFFTLWWRALEETQALPLMPDGGSFPDYRHFLEDLRRFSPYSLSEQAEQIINLKDANGIEAVVTLYSMLTNRLSFRFQVDGRRLTLTRDGLMKYVRSSDPDRRAAAYRALHRVYRREAPLLGQMYANRVRDWSDEHVRLRGFESPLAVRNLGNDMPAEAVHALLDACVANTGLFNRYFQLKAHHLGLPRLRRYDLYAPISHSHREVPYGEAVTTVLDTFDHFHPRLAELAERVFAERHIDSEIRPGKQGGAFCATVLPRHTPWVLINYTGEVRDVATLAHELGHAVHSMLAGDHSVLTQHPTLPLAETASVFGEMLVTDRLLAQEEDPSARRALLGAALDDIYATVIRQAFFVRFEIEAHQAVLEHVSHEQLNRRYLSNLREQFGDSIDLSEDFQYEWLSIPHIYNTPFYCYAYSFGQLLVLALYRRFQLEGEAFKPGYLRLLSYGGGARPAAILNEVGIDMTDPAFWQGGFEVVRSLVDELEGL